MATAEQAALEYVQVCLDIPAARTSTPDSLADAQAMCEALKAAIRAAREGVRAVLLTSKET